MGGISKIERLRFGKNKIMQIKKKYNVNFTELAKMLNVDRTTLWRILHRR